MTETSNPIWPNVLPIEDGIVPVEDIPQDADFLDDDNLDEEMD